MFDHTNKGQLVSFGLNVRESRVDCYRGDYPHLPTLSFSRGRNLMPRCGAMQTILSGVRGIVPH